jgi:hypothetical protein
MFAQPWHMQQVHFTMHAEGVTQEHGHWHDAALS